MVARRAWWDRSPRPAPTRRLDSVTSLDEISGGRFVFGCLEIGRDPASIGRSAGIIVEPTDVTGAAEALAVPLQGSAEEIADGIRAFRHGGFTQVEIVLWPRTLAALEAMAPVLELLDAD